MLGLTFDPLGLNSNPDPFSRSTSDLSTGIDLPRERPMTLPWESTSDLSTEIDLPREGPMTLPWD